VLVGEGVGVLTGSVADLKMTGSQFCMFAAGVEPSARAVGMEGVTRAKTKNNTVMHRENWRMSRLIVVRILLAGASSVNHAGLVVRCGDVR
jgi:hypothetical protein